MYDPEIHHRRSIRWRHYDYSQPGFYYVTICVQGHRTLLGRVSAGIMELNDAGRMVDTTWRDIPQLFPSMRPDEHVTMPNHFHGILQIVSRSQEEVAPTLADAVGAFKSKCTDAYIARVDDLNWPRFDGRFWPRNSYEHVIRDNDELEKIRQYIQQNPLRWSCDRYNPENSVLVADETGLLVPWQQS